MMNANHEYGHYIDLGVFQKPFTNPMTEGWAMFFSFAVNAYATNNYGEDLSRGDNCEIGPYYYNESTIDGVTTVFPRFGNMNKISYLAGGPVVGADMCRFACLLWNLYDSYNDNIFMPEAYIGKNNDDVNYQGLALMNTYRTQTFSDHSEFKNVFIESVATNNASLEESINKIYNFMEFGSNWDSPIPTNKWMRSMPSTYNFHFIENELITNLSWVSNSYTFGNNSFEWCDTKDWSTAKQGNHEYWNFDNPEIGHKIYKRIGQNYNLISTILMSESQQSVDFGDMLIQHFKVSTYNNSGDSYIPLEFITPFNRDMTFLPKLGSGLKDDTESLSTPQINKDDLIECYPNPLNDKLEIKLPLNDATKAQVFIYDLNNRLIINKNIIINNIDKNKLIIDCKMLPSGSFNLVIKLNDSDNSVFSKLIQKIY